MSDIDWKAISTALKEPFPFESIGWRPQGNPSNGQVQVTAYLDSRDVQDRLDAVVGTENWEFDWSAIVTDAKGLLVAKGVLSIYGIPKAEVGDASNWEPNKGTISDALKRCAVLWGVGRYLYRLPDITVKWTGSKPAESEIPRLKALLNGEKPAQPAAQPKPQQPQQPLAEVKPHQQDSAPPANEQQLTSIRKLCAALGREEPDPKVLSIDAAGALLRQLSRDYNAQRRAG